jgi:hypothetical protein
MACRVINIIPFLRLLGFKTVILLKSIWGVTRGYNTASVVSNPAVWTIIWNHRKMESYLLWCLLFKTGQHGGRWFNGDKYHSITHLKQTQHERNHTLACSSETHFSTVQWRGWGAGHCSDLAPSAH